MKKLIAAATRLWYTLMAVDIRVKIIGLAVGSVLLLGTMVTLHMRAIMARNLDEELAFLSTSIAEQLATEAATPILTGNIFALHQVLNTTLQSNSMIRYTFIVDAQGNVLDHTFGKGFPAGLATANNITVDRNTRMEILSTDEGSVWDVAAPILEGKSGVARVGLSDKRKVAVLVAAVREHLLVTAGVAISGLIVAFLLGSFISAQIKTLSYAARTVANGDLGYQVKVWIQDDLGNLAQAFNAMSTNLARMRQDVEQREAVRRRLLAKVIAAQEEERQRVARELHDDLGQLVSSLGYGLQSASIALEADPIRVKSMLRGLYEENLRIQKELRATIYSLRPSVLDDLGLIPALRSYAESRLASQGIDVKFTIEGEWSRLSSEIETALFRITQEALNNVVRHSKAHNVWVHAKLNMDEMTIDIKDDGHGFDASTWNKVSPDGRGFGLLGMRERAELLGGHLELSSGPGQGCHVRVHLPTTEYKVKHEENPHTYS